VERVLDLLAAIPKRALLATVGICAVAAPLLAWMIGGAAGIWAALGAVALVVLAGAALAARVHVERLPLELSAVAVEGRLDGHRAIRVRVRLGRGRRMDRVRGRVRFLPPDGPPIDLAPLAPDARGVVGPWTLVAVDRADALPGGAGIFEVEVAATEGGRTLTARRTYGGELVVAGRFRAGFARRGGRLVLDRAGWSGVERAEV